MGGFEGLSEQRVELRSCGPRGLSPPPPAATSAGEDPGGWWPRTSHGTSLGSRGCIREGGGWQAPAREPSVASFPSVPPPESKLLQFCKLVRKKKEKEGKRSWSASRQQGFRGGHLVPAGVWPSPASVVRVTPAHLGGAVCPPARRAFTASPHSTPFDPSFITPLAMGRERLPAWSGGDSGQPALSIPLGCCPPS